MKLRVLLLLTAALSGGPRAWAQAATGDTLQLRPGPQARQLPDYYVVQPGDTLWDISTRFLGDPHYWPQLWSINDYITNPHWIYPGNRIVFVPGSEIEPPSITVEGEAPSREGFVTERVTFEETGRPCGLDVHFQSELPTQTLVAPAYMEDSHELEIAGKLFKAHTGMLSLGENDLVYLRLDDPESWTCGDVATIVRRLKRRVKHPERGGGKYGRLYRVLGEARILHVQGNVALAELRTSYAEMERGDLVVHKLPVQVAVEVPEPRGSLEGRVVARLGAADSSLTFPYDVLFIDRGEADGVRVGNTFYLVESRDEVLEPESEDLDLPPSVIGRMVVVRVDETSSTAVLIDAARDVDVGTRVTMHLD